MPIPRWPAPKDPDEAVPYDINWLPRLKDESGVQVGSIAASSWALDVDLSTDALLVIGQKSFSATRTQVWLSGGTLGATYVLTNSVTTEDGWEMQQSVKLRIREK